MTLFKFAIREIEAHPDGGFVIGVVEIGLLDDERPNLGHSATLKVRISHSGSATLEALEASLLAKASGLLTRLVPIVQQGTVESLRQQVLDREAAKQEAYDASLRELGIDPASVP